MDLLLEIIIQIIKAIFSASKRKSTVPPGRRMALNNPPPQPGKKADYRAESSRGVRPAGSLGSRPSDDPSARQGESAYERKSREVWDAYRRRQEALAAELRTKEPKR